MMSAEVTSVCTKLAPVASHTCVKRLKEMTVLYGNVMSTTKVRPLKRRGDLCTEPGCDTRATYGHEGQKKPLFCAKHVLPTIELAHAISKQVDTEHQTDEFRDNFKLLKKAESLGYYDPSLPLEYNYYKQTPAIISANSGPPQPQGGVIEINA